VAKIHADRIPGFLEALARERTVREQAFLGYVEPILGIDLAPLTLERLNLLILAENRYLCGGEARIADVLQLLWICSKAFTFERKDRDKFIRRHAPAVLAENAKADAAILEYIGDAFLDVDPPGGKLVHEPLAAWMAQHVFIVAKETGWSRDVIYRQLGFNEVMQYVRLAERHNGGTVLNPLSGEKKMRWLEGLNAPATPDS
jgi:DNA-binding phage protein